MSNIFDEYIQKWQRKNELYAKIGKAYNIRESESLCDVELLDGADVLDCRLNPLKGSQNGVTIIPANGAWVIVVFLTSDEAFVAMTGTTDKVLINTDKTIFNDGENGMINILDLVSKLNKFVNEITLELPKIAAGIATGGGSYTPGTISQFTASDFEDKNILH